MAAAASLGTLRRQAELAALEEYVVLLRGVQLGSDPSCPLPIAHASVALPVMKRFAGLETIPFVSVEANYFFLSDGQTDESFSSSGEPVLGRPYINAVTGRPTATLISAPGVAAGTVTIAARTLLWGAEASLAAGVPLRRDRLLAQGLNFGLELRY